MTQLVQKLDQHVRGMSRLYGSLFEESVLLACSLKLVKLYRADGRTLEAPARSGAMSAHKLRMLLDFIMSNLSQPLALEAMAQAVYLSPYHLCRQFRQTMSISLWQYVLKCRVAYATRLIARCPDMPIADIACACGFESYTAFYTAFQKFHGVSPARFRGNALSGK